MKDARIPDHTISQAKRRLRVIIRPALRELGNPFKGWAIEASSEAGSQQNANDSASTRRQVAPKGDCVADVWRLRRLGVEKNIERRNLAIANNDHV